jgi:hypothetical protein
MSSEIPTANDPPKEPETPEAAEAPEEAPAETPEAPAEPVGGRLRIPGGVTLAMEFLVAGALYLVAAAALTWPALKHPDEIIIGGGELGGWLWRYWWHFMEVDAIGQSDLSIFEKIYTFISLGRYPETGNILDILLISFPLQLFWELPAHYNFKIFIILLGDGLCGYALARHVTRSRAAALAGGLIAVINPLVVQDLIGSGLRQVLLWWMLLFPIFLDRAERLKRPGSGAIAGVLLALIGAFYWFYGLFAGLFLAFWGIDFLIRRRGYVKLGRLASWGAPFVIALLLVAGFFVSPYVIGDDSGAVESASQLPELTYGLRFPTYDMIFDAPLRPSNYAENVLSSLNRTIVSSWALDYLFRPSYFRALPIGVLVLGIIPALIFRPLPRSRARFWLFVFFFFFVASLGPYLKLATTLDHTSAEVFKLQIGDESKVIRLLPFTEMFRWLPGMSRMFAPYRVASMVVVASVALVAAGVGRVPDRIRGWRLGAPIRGLLALLVIATSFAQVSYRWEIGPVAIGSYAPQMWRPAVPVSAIEVPEWYRELDPTEMHGIIELPLEQQQDLLYFYQIYHRQKVYRSWATPPAIPPIFREDGGGEPGERMRYLARQDRFGQTAGDALLRFSRQPTEIDLERELQEVPFAHLAIGGDYRWLIIHERGFYLADPLRGQIYYRDAVRKVALWLGVEPTEVVEHKWFDYPGNQFDVPNGPVYIPWASTEVNLPDQDMPNRYFMSVFDLKPWLDVYDGPLPDFEAEERGPEHREAAPGEAR